MTSSLTDHAGAPTGDRPATGRPGGWRTRSRLTSPGWALLPLRVFLGVTFGYAGVSKLLDPAYLDAASPIGVRAQMLQVVGSSPIGALVQRSADHPTVTGLAIAFGEIAVGIGALLGLFTRLAALGGVLLALSFYLTVSWTTRPYYFGADLGFAFAWTPLLLAGDGGVLSLTQALRSRARRELGLRAAGTAAGSSPVPASVVDPAVEEPVMSTQDIEKTVERRTVLRGGLLGTAIGAVVVGAGTVVAFARRSGPSAAPAAPAAAQVAAAPSGGAGAASSSPAGAPAGAAGGPIAAVAEVPVGGSKAFTAPGGGPAVLLHPDQGRFTAFHAACTHKGCPVSWTGSGFQCPCHGATFSATGEVTGGPAKAPLAAIPVTVADGQVRPA